jgi:hypothetical protein
MASTPDTTVVHWHVGLVSCVDGSVLARTMHLETPPSRTYDYIAFKTAEESFDLDGVKPSPPSYSYCNSGTVSFAGFMLLRIAIKSFGE